jgi:hypothetical protein
VERERLDVLDGRLVNRRVVRRRFVIAVERLATSQGDRRDGVDVSLERLVGALDDVVPGHPEPSTVTASASAL